MPKSINIPGQGIIRFPDEMPDDEIKSVIKRKFFTETGTAHTESIGEPTSTATNQPENPQAVMEAGIQSSTALTDAVVRSITSPAAGEASKEGRAQAEQDRLDAISKVKPDPYVLAKAEGRPSGMESGTELLTAMATGIPKDVSRLAGMAEKGLAAAVDAPPNIWNRIKGLNPGDRGYVEPIGEELISDAIKSGSKSFLPDINAYPKDPNSVLDTVTAEAANLLLGIPKFIASPIGSMTAGIGAMGTVGATAVRYAFTSDMIKSMAEQAPELYRVVTGDSSAAEKSKAITRFLGTGAMAAMLTHPEWKSASPMKEPVELKVQRQFDEASKSASKIMGLPVVNPDLERLAPQTAATIKSIETIKPKEEHAIPVEIANAEVLRQPQPEVGLPQVGARNAEPETPAAAQESAAPAQQAEVKTDIEIAQEPTESLVKRTAVGADRDAAFTAKRAAAVKVASGLKTGDVIIDTDGERRVLDRFSERGAAKGEFWWRKEGGDENSGGVADIAAEIANGAKIERKTPSPGSKETPPTAPVPIAESVGVGETKKYIYKSPYRPVISISQSLPKGWELIDERTFSLDKPLSIDQIKSLELEPTDPNHPINIKKRFSEFSDKLMNSMDSDRGGVVTFNDGSSKIVSENTLDAKNRDKYPFRVTHILKDGTPTGHEIFKDWDEVKKYLWGQHDEIKSISSALPENVKVSSSVSEKTGGIDQLQNKPATTSVSVESVKEQPATPIKQPAKELWQMTHDEFLGEVPSGTSTVVTDSGKIVSGADHGDARTRAENRGESVGKEDELGKRSGWFKFGKNILVSDLENNAFHKSLVEQAIKEGKPVPPEVLNDYPDLKLPTTASDASPKQSVQSASGPTPTVPETPAPVKNVAKAVRAVRIFDRETELNGPDILSWMKENGKLLSKAAAKRLWGKEKFKLNASLWDDSVTLSKPHHDFAIYSDKGSGPDRVAQAAYDAKMLKEPSVNLLWEEINKASKARANAFEGAAKEARLLEEESKQVEAWQAAIKEGEKRIPASELKVGDFMDVDGEHVEVTHVDPEGTVTLKDGSKFGTQIVSEGKTLHVEKYEPAPESKEFVPPEKPKASGELFSTAETPFNLTGQKTELVTPKTETTKFGEQTLAQDELFGIQKVVESKDPTKSADAAQQMYGGPKEAVAKLENQLRVVDSDPQTKKSFSKEQRERLKEVIALLRQRVDASAKPAETRTPIEILNQSSRIKVSVPDGATQVRVTDSKGRKSVMPLSDVNKGDNPFRGSDAVKVEAGTIGKDKQFVPMKGELKVTDKTPSKEEHQRTSRTNDAFERARAGDESAFDDLENQFKEIYPEPEELGAGRRNPNQVHTPQDFETLFNRAFATRDFETILDAIKASDVSVWKPMMKDLLSKQAKDPLAATKVDWFRHVFNGTVPSEAIPRPAPKASATPPPPSPGTPPRPSGPAPPPPSPPPVRIPVEPITGGTPKSPFQIINDFSEVIGKAIRVLRMKKNGLGVYRPGSTLTAEKFAGDLDTAAHELAGHWTDDKYGIGKPWVTPRTRSPYDAELAKFWIHGSVTPTSSLRYRRAEGIAEFIRAYVVNPKQAKLDAPRFAAYFEKSLPPEALKAINDFGVDVRTWAGSDPLARAGLNIRMNPPTLRERLWNGLRGRGFGFQNSPIDRLRLWFDDPYHYAVKAFHEAVDLQGLPVKPEDNFELLSRLLATHDARMSDQFERGLVPLRPHQVPNAKGELSVERLIDPVTKEPMTMEWLLDAFDKKDMPTMEKDMRDVSAFMVAQRTIEKGAQLGRESNVSGIGAGIMSDKQAAQELLNRVASEPAKEARLKEAARRYRLWADQNIQMLVDAGRLSPERAIEIRDSNQQYVDMHRLSEEFDTGNKATRTKGIGTTKDVIKRFKGSTLELDNVYSNLLEQTDAIQKEAHRNVVMRSFTDALTQARELHGPDLKDFDQFGRKVTSADSNTVKVFNSGKPEYWQFDPDIHESLKGLGELGTHAFIDLLAFPSRLARYVITHGPQFLARNVVRDTFERSVTSRNASKPWDILQGYNKDQLSRYEVFGGGQFGNYIVDRHVWNRELKKVMRDLSKDPTNIFLSPLKIKHGWEKLSEKSEKIGRIAEFRRAFEHGKNELGYDDYNAALYAAGEARGLLDFAKAGTVMRVINRLVPFSNARLRGLARATFSFKENPTRFALRWGMFVLTPTILTMLWNRRDKETWDEYQQQPAYLRDFFWNFKIGDYWFRIPKPHELGVMAGGVERAISHLIGDRHAFDGYAGSASNAALPIQNPVEGTGPLKTMLELQFNRDTFRNREIIPSWEKDLKLELRKGTKYASGTGRGIASAINMTGLSVDPRNVDFLLQSYGGLGQIATSIADPKRTIGDTALKSTGYVVEPPGTSARDVQWVIDWAKNNGKMQTSQVRQLQKLRKAVMDERDIKQRHALSQDLIRFATAMREQVEADYASP